MLHIRQLAVPHRRSQRAEGFFWSSPFFRYKFSSSFREELFRLCFCFGLHYVNCGLPTPHPKLVSKQILLPPPNQKSCQRLCVPVPLLASAKNSVLSVFSLYTRNPESTFFLVVIQTIQYYTTKQKFNLS